MPFNVRIGPLANEQKFYKQPGQETEVLWHQDAGYGWPGSAGERDIAGWHWWT